MEIDEIVLTGNTMPVYFKTTLKRKQGFLLKLDEERNGVWVQTEDDTSSHFVPMSSISHMRAVVTEPKPAKPPARRRGRPPKKVQAGVAQ